MLTNNTKQMLLVSKMLKNTRLKQSSQHELPLFLQSEAEKRAYNDFLAHRRYKDGKLSPLSIKRINKSLSELKAKGADLVSCIEESILKGYRGVFEARVSKKTSSVVEERRNDPQWQAMLERARKRTEERKNGLTLQK